MGFIDEMTDAERLSVLRSLVKSNMEPLELLIKVLVIVEPQPARRVLIGPENEPDYVI